MTGKIVLRNGARINKWAVWTYNGGMESYEQSMLIDLSKSENEVGFS